MFLLEDVFEAYFDCRKNKRNSKSALEFEVNWRKNCVELWKELNSRTYRQKPSIAFVVLKPKPREVFAANFRDRVCHHLFDMKTQPLFEKDFRPETFNNRKGKGTGACVEHIGNCIKKVSKNYQESCWILRMDIKNFFMSIDRKLLQEKTEKYLKERYLGTDLEDLLYLTRGILEDRPELNCILKSPIHFWKRLEPGKSLFEVGKKKGLPVGNLPSQVLANFYLNDFDHYVIEQGVKHYGRYVDDFLLVHKRKEKLLQLIPKLRENLSNVFLTLHPKKFYCQNFHHGVEVVGTVLKKERKYLSNRTIGNINTLIKSKKHFTKLPVEKIQARVNSYLGFLKHKNSYKIRRKICRTLQKLEIPYIYIQEDYSKILVDRENTFREKIKRNINKHRHERD